MPPLDLEAIFTYHRPFGDQADRYGTIRATARSLAHTIVYNTPASAEQTLAIRHLQQAVMWANAAIAVNERELAALPEQPSGPVEIEHVPPPTPEAAPEPAPTALCARQGCGHAYDEHGPMHHTCLTRVDAGTSGAVADLLCGCMGFTLDPTTRIDAGGDIGGDL